MVLQNREFMKTMFDRRGKRELIEPEALEYAIEMSGGLVREYIRIIRDAALNSIAFGKESIDMDCVQDVINDLKNAYRSQLSDEDYETLESVIQTKQIKRDKILVRLLNNLSVLEYAKGGFDVNPVVRLIME
jgi:DNA polymerase III delta prime subunit